MQRPVLSEKILVEYYEILKRANREYPQNVVMALPATFMRNHVILAHQSESQTREGIINSYRLMTKLC